VVSYKGPRTAEQLQVEFSVYRGLFVRSIWTREILSLVSTDSEVSQPVSHSVGMTHRYYLSYEGDYFTEAISQYRASGSTI
jgi:hypothetical protein